LNEIVAIDFHGAALLARKGETPETTMVAMKPVVEGMGLNWASQFTKITAHPVLSKGIAEIAIPSAGGPQDMTALPLNRLNFWLATINPKKVPDPATRAKVVEYQTECADVLFNHFFAKAAGTALDARTVGGIVKAVTNKLLAERDEEWGRRFAILQAEIRTLIVEGDPRIAVVEYRPMLDVLKDEGVVQKG
jgi:hypothetical protein